jgi:hypothetical protein
MMTQQGDGGGLVVKRIAARLYELRYDGRLLATLPYGEALPIITGKMALPEILARYGDGLQAAQG